MPDIALLHMIIELVNNDDVSTLILKGKIPMLLIHIAKSIPERREVALK